MQDYGRPGQPLLVAVVGHALDSTVQRDRVEEHASLLDGERQALLG